MRRAATTESSTMASLTQSWSHMDLVGEVVRENEVRGGEEEDGGVCGAVVGMLNRYNE